MCGFHDKTINSDMYRPDCVSTILSQVCVQSHSPLPWYVPIIINILCNQISSESVSKHYTHFRIIADQLNARLGSVNPQAFGQMENAYTKPETLIEIIPNEIWMKGLRTDINTGPELAPVEI